MSDAMPCSTNAATYSGMRTGASPGVVGRPACHAAFGVIRGSCWGLGRHAAQTMLAAACILQSPNMVGPLGKRLPHTSDCECRPAPAQARARCCAPPAPQSSWRRWAATCPQPPPPCQSPTGSSPGWVGLDGSSLRMFVLFGHSAKLPLWMSASIPAGNGYVHTGWCHTLPLGPCPVLCPCQTAGQELHMQSMHERLRWRRCGNAPHRTAKS